MKGTKKILCLMLSLVLVGMTGCSTQNKPTPSAEPSTDPQETSTALQDSDVDVLVIGAGGAGLSAAVSATENGASVIVVEKM
ncbi:MAG: FAD-binding protein, partial [Holdemania filiformis]